MRPVVSKSAILSVLTATAVLLCCSTVFGFDPGMPDTVSIDSVVAFVSSGAVVPIRFVNDEPLAAIQIAITLPRTVVRLDSLSFVGSRVEEGFTSGLVFNEDSSKVAIIVSSTSQQVIPVGSGIFARAYFSWPVSTSPQLLTIDSARWLPDPQLEYYTYFVTTGPQELLPQFRKGCIDIKADPVRPDSLWIVSNEGNVGATVAVDVGLFNQKNLKALGLAMTWGTDRLTLDSISINDTRGATAISRTLSPKNAFHQMFAELEFADLSPLASGTGVVARLYFGIDAACPETTITIDTTTFGFIQKSYVKLTSSDGGIEFMPLFRAGTIEVKAGTAVDDGVGQALPISFSLDQNFPNPFNPSTEIRFSLPQASRVRIDIYDIMGRNIRTLLDEPRPAGTHQVTFDGRARDGSTLATGVYFYRLETDRYSQSRKMLLLK